MRSAYFIPVCALLVGSPALAADSDYVANVQKAFDLASPVKRIAVAPVSCPQELDCGDLQEEIEKLFGKRTQLQIITAADTKKMMERAGIPKIDFETRYILLEGLKADAILTLDIEQANVEMVEGNVVKIGDAEVQDTPVKVKHVKLAMEMATKDGSTLLQTSGEAKVQGLKGLEGVAKRTLETMIEQSVPEKE